MSNQREIFARNLKRLLDSRGIDQKRLSEHLELSEMAVSHWVNGTKYPRMTNIQRIADYFGVKKSELIEGGGEKQAFTSGDYKYFPSYVSAGLPNDTEANTEYETISIADKIMGKHANSKDIYFIKVNGESMNKIIPHNSLVAVKPVSSIHDLKIDDIVVYRKDSEYAIKRLVIDKDKWIFKPESTDDTCYDDVVYKDDDVTIKGKGVLYIVEVE